MPSQMFKRTMVGLLVVMSLTVSQARADTVLVSGVEMNAEIVGYLASLGHTVTIVDPSAFGSTSFAGYDAIWLGWNSSFSGLAGRKADLEAFVSAGGNLLAEIAAPGNPIGDYPFGDELALQHVSSDQAQIVDPAFPSGANHPLNAGLTSD